MVIDFGNGITCDTEGPSDASPGGLLAGDSGLDAPDVELSMTENANLDGGVFFGSRAVMRSMTLPVGHEQAWTKREIQQAFTPNVLRTISTELGSMPYYVEKLMFPKSAAQARRQFTVVIKSPLAYPLGALLEVEASSIYDYSTTTHDTGVELLTVPPFSGALAHIAQTINVANGDLVVGGGFKVAMAPSAYAALQIRKYTSDINTSTLVKEQIVYAYELQSGYALMSCDPSLGEPGVTYLLRMVYNVNEVHPYTDTAAGATTGVAYYNPGPAGYIPGDSNDSTTDWAHKYMTGTPDTDTTTVYLDPQTDVECYPVVTITLAEATEELSVTDGVNTAVLTGSMEVGDVVVIDSANLTVTVDGTDRIAWFTGDFPVLYPDSGYIESSSPGTIGVQWQPRLMGLL